MFRRWKAGGDLGLVPLYRARRQRRVSDGIIDLARIARLEYRWGSTRTRIWLERVHKIRVNAKTIQRIVRDMGVPVLAKTPKRKPKQLKLFEKEAPGDSIQVDVKVIKLTREKVFQYTALDDCTRYRVRRLYKRLNQHSSLQFLTELRRALPFPMKKRQCDNGSEFSLAFTLAVEAAGIKHRYITPRRPQQHGKVERSHRIDEEEFWSRHEFDACDDAEAPLADWERRCNHDRFSVALGGRAPVEKHEAVLAMPALLSTSVFLDGWQDRLGGELAPFHRPLLRRALIPTWRNLLAPGQSVPVFLKVSPLLLSDALFSPCGNNLLRLHKCTNFRVERSFPGFALVQMEAVNMCRYRNITLAAAFLMLLPALVFAQAGITGTVRDTSGAVLPGVTVEAASPALIEKVRSVTTDGAGQYRIENLRPGAYTVTFTLVGFNTFRREGIELAGSFTATVDAVMPVGAIEDAITVTGVAPTVDVQSTNRQQVMSADVIDALPTGRMYNTLGVLTPGVTSNRTDVGGTEGDVMAQLAIHGGRGQDQRVLTNGLNYFTPQLPAIGGNVPNMSGTQEVTIDTSGANAETQTGGVTFNFIQRDGGNTFGGTAFLSYANEGMASSNFTQRLRDAGLTAVNTLKSTMDINPGFGGPLRKDRLWFYASGRYQTSRLYAPGMFYNKNEFDPTKWTSLSVV